MDYFVKELINYISRINGFNFVIYSIYMFLLFLIFDKIYDKKYSSYRDVIEEKINFITETIKKLNDDFSSIKSVACSLNKLDFLVNNYDYIVNLLKGIADTDKRVFHTIFSNFVDNLFKEIITIYLHGENGDRKLSLKNYYNDSLNSFYSGFNKSSISSENKKKFLIFINFFEEKFWDLVNFFEDRNKDYFLKNRVFIQYLAGYWKLLYEKFLSSMDNFNTIEELKENLENIYLYVFSFLFEEADEDLLEKIFNIKR